MRLEQPYHGLLDRLPDEGISTSTRPATSRTASAWTACFRAELYTLFKIDPTRSTDVLINALGTEFEGVLGCDYFSSYRSYLRRFDVSMQFCLAHLIRDVKFLTTLPDTRDRAYGDYRLRAGLRDLFQVIHRREHFSAVPEPIGVGPVQVPELCKTDVPATKHSHLTWRPGSRSMARVISSSLRPREWSRPTPA